MAAYLTPEEFGARLVPPVSKQRVCVLCAERRIPGARRTVVGLRASWSIPVDAPDPRRAPGRPRIQPQD